jgi:GT2 family glycosyltransferase
MSTPEGDRLTQDVARLRQRLDRAAENIAHLEQRLERIENSLLFRAARWAGAFGATRKRKLGQWLLHSPLHRLYAVSRRAPSSEAPAAGWIDQFEASLPSPEWHVDQARQWPWQPLISVILPVSNPKREWLEAAVNSVLEQSYARWQLCVCDDGSEDAAIAHYFEALAKTDNRVRFTRSDRCLGIAAALNAAGSLATGNYLAFLDHDDVLHRYALHYVAEALQDRTVAVVYTDENDIDEDGSPVTNRFKPDWSPDLLLSCMYFGHLFVAARDSVEKAGWFRSCCDGAQDYDLALRITREPVRVRHIPLPLYHWRRHAASTASSAAAKPYTHAAGRKALGDALSQRGTVATVEDGPLANTYFVRRKIIGNPLVSIIICSRNPKLLARCLQSLEKHTDYSPRELIVICHEAAPSSGFDTVLNRFGATGIRYTGAFNFARMNNAGAEAARGDHLLFLNDDVQALQPDWLEYLAAHIQRPEIGAAGAKLVYPSGAIQHAGIVTGIMDGAGHPGRGLFRSDEYPWLDLTRNVSAVTGACLGIRKSVFSELAGFDEAFPVNYNDVDLCLRARRAGYLIVLEPRAILRHDECRSRTRGTRYEERERFYDRWGDVLNAPDPYYSPRFDRSTEEIRLSDPSALVS